MAPRQVAALALAAAFLLGGCSGSASPSTGSGTVAPGATSASTQVVPRPSATAAANPDGTMTDSDGFVRFPGEPTRQDPGHYYLVEDICGQFTQPFMERLSGKTFKKVAPSGISGNSDCNYYVATRAADGRDDYILLVLNYLSVDNQKTGQKALGRAVASNPAIPMENFVATQANGVINAIYFVFGAQKFLRLDRTSTSVISDSEMLALAVKLGAKMQDFR